MRILKVACLAVLVTACSVGDAGEDGTEGAQARSSAEAVTIGSGVQGYVFIGPVCPGPASETGCPDQPFEAELAVTDSEGQEVAIGISDSTGYFRIPLSPGDYILIPAQERFGLPPYAAPIPFAVSSGRYTELEVNYDSGVR